MLATVLAAAVLLFGASRIIGGVRGALNDVWGVQTRAGGGLKGYVLTKLFDLGMVLAVGFMFLATMVGNAVATAWVPSLLECPASARLDSPGERASPSRWR